MTCSRRVIAAWCGTHEPDVRELAGEHGRRIVATVTAMKVRFTLLGLLLFSSALPLGAGTREPLAVRVSPAVSFAPANLIVRATIEADAGNRSMEIIAESSEFYRSSEIQLDGDNAPRTNTFEFRSLPSGTYEVKAILYGADGQPRAQARQQVNVIANGAGH